MLALIALVLASHSGPVAAQDTAFGAWGLACTAIAPGETRCALFQRRIREGGGVIAELQLVGLETGQTPALAVTAPMGVWLPAGVTITVDSAAPASAVYDRCLQAQGCIARVDHEGIVDLLEKGRELRVAYGAGPLDSQRTELTFSLIGIREGIAAIRSGSGGTAARR